MEQALVLASIVLGVAIAFELEHLSRILRAKNVKWHWAQPMFALFVLLSIIAFWWGATEWATRAEAAGEQLSLGRFLPIMWNLVLLALLAAVSFPDSVPDEGIDLAEYYQDNRKYQWSLMALYFWSVYLGYAVNVIQTSTSVGQALGMLVGDTFFSLVMTGMIFARKWWQIGIGFAVLSLIPLFWVTRTLG